MFLIRTHVGPSTIQGLGVFASEPVTAGTPVWRFEATVDRLLDPAEVERLPDAMRAFLATYSYPSADFPGRLVLSGDHARFLNHSDAPNIGSSGLTTHALRSIAAGEELTCDYGATVEGWAGF